MKGRWRSDADDTERRMMEESSVTRMRMIYASGGDAMMRCRGCDGK
jgi:hypothetical protein